MGIQVDDINKRYKDKIILDHVNLEVDTGEMVALLGPSGSGKTTLLRIIAGLEIADSGQILLDGENMLNKSVQEREVGFVFQHYALFRHMTVFENAAFGLKVKPFKQRPSTGQIKDKVFSLLEKMHLEGYQDHYPHQLSGGQQQRVALVRALAVDPKVLLLDEPFGALDAKVRKELRRWIRLFHDEFKVSSIFVTHDQEEALAVADRVGLMDKGCLLQVDTPGRIWRHPVNPFVFSFLGEHNEFEGWQDEDSKFHLTQSGTNTRLKPVKVYARPYEVHVDKNQEPDSLPARILHVNSTGSLVKLELRAENHLFYHVEISHREYEELRVKKGHTVFIRPKRTFYFTENS